jgi:ubiquinone/menaquinone biosynthesis C-methylase UbiE
MGQAGFIPLRQSLLSQASGEVLEIGFGTGANLTFYPSHIHSLTAIDPNPGMIFLARSHLKEKMVAVHPVLASAEWLPFPSASFDTVVSTMTLCSVPDLSKTLQALCRVVKHGGQFLFLEHGQSPDRPVQRW